MNESTKNALLSLGMNLDETLARLANNEGLLLRLLGKFSADTSFQTLEKAVAEGDMEEGFRAAHTLKGVAGNLGLGGLFDAVSPLVEALRGGEGADNIPAMMDGVRTQHTLAIDTIGAISG